MRGVEGEGWRRRGERGGGGGVRGVEEEGERGGGGGVRGVEEEGWRRRVKDGIC